MRSIWSSGIASSEVAPTDDEPTRKPSISTSVCPRLAPRRNAPDVEPGPPFIVISTPGWRCRSSVRLCAPLRMISSRPITVTSARRSAMGCCLRGSGHRDGREVGWRACATTWECRDRGDREEKALSVTWTTPQRCAVQPRTAVQLRIDASTSERRLGAGRSPGLAMRPLRSLPIA